MTPKKIPKVKPDSWLFGNMKSFSKDPDRFLKKCAETYGDIFQFRVAHKRFIAINHPDYIQHVLQTNHRNYKQFSLVKLIIKVIGDGLFALEGEQWKKERRLMQPYFHKEIVRSYFTTIDNHAKKMFKDWPSKPELWLRSEMGDLVLDITSKCLLGENVEGGAAIIKENLFYGMVTIMGRVKSPIQPPLWFPTAKNQKFNKSVTKLKKFLIEVIRSKEKEENLTGNDLMTMFILFERSGEIPKKQIYNEFVTLMSAGYETTATALFSLIVNVYKDDAIRKKVVEEYNRVTKGGPIKVEHVDQLQYVNNVINESLRLWSPAFMQGREAIKNEKMNGYPIKKGDTILIVSQLIHRHTKFWKNPNVFDPDRFDQELPHKYAYLPFGRGPRMCIGMNLALMEMQVILYHMLKSNFEIEVPSNTEIEYEVTLSYRPKTDIRVIKPITKQH